MTLTGALPVVADPAIDTEVDWPSAIARLNESDPQSPDTLEARLSYADSLTQSREGSCRNRLDTAQSQLDLVNSAPATAVVLLSGTARAAAVEYQIHLARADCDSDDLTRKQELRAALDAAQRARALYDESFDAVAMTTMQFNSSVAYRKLGDDAAALKALQATIALDREYGYRDDATDNYGLLLSWSGETASPERIAELMKDFPQRSINLTFHAAPGEVHVDYSADYTRVLGDAVVHTHGTRSAVRRIAQHGKDWSVSFTPTAPVYTFSPFPEGSAGLEDYWLSLSRMLLNFHDLVIRDDGSFERSSGAATFGRRIRADMRALSETLQQRASRSPAKSRFDRVGDVALLWDSRDAEAAEDYNLEQGTWLGAALKQGVWYSLEAPMSLPTAPQLFVMHEIEFAFTRPAPCVALSKELDCVELVLRAQPDPVSLRFMLREARSVVHPPPQQTPQVVWNTQMRLVLDPATLRPYLRDMRHQTYASQGVSSAQKVIEAEKTVYVYGADQPRI